jgi:uracil-DNA glycosylase
MPSLGPIDAPIAIVIDYPSEADRRVNQPLSDYAGGLFFSLLSKIGILKTNCFITTLLPHAPPNDDLEEYISKRKTCPGIGWERVAGNWVHPILYTAEKRLRAELLHVKPRLVITLGEGALWAVTGNQGSSKWRGSRLSPADQAFQVIPTIHPRNLVRDPSQAHLLQIDLKRAKNIYEGKQLPRNYKFILEPSFEDACFHLEQLIREADLAQTGGQPPLPIGGDLETRSGHIACLGIAWSEVDAICIPFLTVDNEKPFYWSVEEETELVYLIYQLFNHPHVVSLGQNYLYDCQYYWRHWGFLPSNVRDTMIGHHSIFSNMRKGLDFLSSMYAHDHVYWKDDIREWDPSLGERQYWTYNCKDACITWEIWPEILASMEAEV